MKRQKSMGRHLWLHLAVLAVVLHCSYAALKQSNDKVAFDQELNTIDDDEQSLKDILKNPKLALADDYRFNKMLKPKQPTKSTTSTTTSQPEKVEIKPRGSYYSRYPGKNPNKRVTDELS